MSVEMVDVKGTILRDVADKAMKRRDIAISYAFGIRQGLSAEDWREINEAILERWSPSGLEWIKGVAWARIEGRM